MRSHASLSKRIESNCDAAVFIDERRRCASFLIAMHGGRPAASFAVFAKQTQNAQEYDRRSV
ncbi:hypothetical protein WS62_25640 [Burkholderia sp. ABCPW 14]|nr:hypothetical protein WS62_25640 [Burkholderia sp. ABCPW 14]